MQRKLTLREYVKRRNGAALGSSGSLTNMFQRALGAGTFIRFWQYWNPVFGYVLGRYIYVPLCRIMPLSGAFVLTFVVSGAVHDLVSMIVQGSITFLFTPWFLLLSLGALFGRALQLNFSHQSWPVRATINASYVVVCLVLTLILKALFAIS